MIIYYKIYKIQVSLIKINQIYKKLKKVKLIEIQTFKNNLAYPLLKFTLPSLQPLSH